MSAGEAQPVWRKPLTAITKGAPARARLGALNAPMPAPYNNSVGLYVTIQQTGWRSVDGRTFRVSAWQNGDAVSFPDLTLEGSDTSGEVGAAMPRNDAFIEIRPTINNANRYPAP